MSLDLVRDIKGYLSSASTITNYVGKNDIKMAWPKTIDSFPCILISQIGGSDYGYLGYRTSDAGSKLRRVIVFIRLY